MSNIFANHFVCDNFRMMDIAESRSNSFTQEPEIYQWNVPINNNENIDGINCAVIISGDKRKKTKSKKRLQMKENVSTNLTLEWFKSLGNLEQVVKLVNNQVDINATNDVSNIMV